MRTPQVAINVYHGIDTETYFRPMSRIERYSMACAAGAVIGGFVDMGLVGYSHTSGIPVAPGIVTSGVTAAIIGLGGMMTNIALGLKNNARFRELNIRKLEARGKTN